MPSKPLKILDLRDSPWVDGPGRTILQTASMVDKTRCEILIGAFCSEESDNHAYIIEARKKQLLVIPIIEKSAFDFRLVSLFDVKS